MKILKRILSSVLAFSLICGLSAAPVNASSYTDVEDGQYYTEAIESLTLYGVISGYAGKFNPASYVTRAEFAKMTSLIAGLEDEVNSSSGQKKFDDVSLSYWGNGYINTVANNMLLVGYPNGHFLPEKNITLAEAVTVLLRVMNYTTADLGDNWPYSYMVKASSLGLTDGMSINSNNYITRADLCVVINRALQTELNGSNNKLISKMDANMTDEVLVIATKNEYAGLEANQVKTDAGTYKLANSSLKFTPLTKVKLVLNKDNEVINFNTTYVPEKVVTTIDSYVDGNVYFTNGTNSKAIGVTDSTPVYSDGSITNYGSFKNSIEEGTSVSIIYDKNGSVGYILFNTAEYTPAAVIRTNIYNALQSVGISEEKINSASVIRNGCSATLEDAKIYDVVYYLEDNKTIYLYSDKISGVYSKAYPNKANVTSIDLSGNVLELETQNAVYKLGERSGSYKLNSRITALLGKDGKIVDIVDLNATSVANYGILLSFGTEMSDDMLEVGKQYNYITFINGEGRTSRYKTLKNYSEKIGDIGKISFDEEGYAVFSNIKIGSNISGAVDKNNKKIGDNWLTSDCVILERTYAPDTRTGTALAQVIDVEDINVSELTAKQILYTVTSGSFDDISLLIVENVTKNQYTYGILKSMSGRANTMTSNGTYEIVTNGKTQTYSANFYTNISAGAGVAMILDGGKLVSLKSLVRLGSSSKLNAIDFSRIKAGSNTFRMGDDVQIFRKTSSGYTSLSLEDAAELIGSTVNIYADTTVSDGGLVRIVVIN